MLSVAVIPIDGKLLFAPNNAVVPVKNGLSKVIFFTPLPDAIAVALCSCLLWNVAVYPNSDILMFWAGSLAVNLTLNLNPLPL